MRRTSVLALVGVLATLAHLAASCASSQEAPFGLESIVLPDGQREIEATLSEMPDELLGRDVNPLSAGSHMVRLSYGAGRDPAIAVTDFGAGTGDFPARTVGEFLPDFVESGEVDVSESDLEGDLLWFTGQNHESNEEGEVLRTFWTMWFGARSSMWVFAVSAPSKEEGIALVEAFMKTVS